MMTMKQVVVSPPPLPRRVGVAEAKSKLSEVLRDAANGPTIIHSRGRDLAVLLTIDAYENLIADRPGGPGSGGAFLNRIAEVKRRHSGAGEDFEPVQMTFRPVDPFVRRRAPK